MTLDRSHGSFSNAYVACATQLLMQGAGHRLTLRDIEEGSVA